MDARAQNNQLEFLDDCDFGDGSISGVQLLNTGLKLLQLDFAGPAARRPTNVLTAPNLRNIRQGEERFDANRNTDCRQRKRERIRMINDFNSPYWKNSFDEETVRRNNAQQPLYRPPSECRDLGGAERCARAQREGMCLVTSPGYHGSGGAKVNCQVTCGVCIPREGAASVPTFPPTPAPVPNPRLPAPTPFQQQQPRFSSPSPTPAPAPSGNGPPSCLLDCPGIGDVRTREDLLRFECDVRQSAQWCWSDCLTSGDPKDRTWGANIQKAECGGVASKGQPVDQVVGRTTGPATATTTTTTGTTTTGMTTTDMTTTDMAARAGSSQPAAPSAAAASQPAAPPAAAAPVAQSEAPAAAAPAVPVSQASSPPSPAALASATATATAIEGAAASAGTGAGTSTDTRARPETLAPKAAAPAPPDLASGQSSRPAPSPVPSALRGSVVVVAADPDPDVGVGAGPVARATAGKISSLAVEDWLSSLGFRLRFRLR